MHIQCSKEIRGQGVRMYKCTEHIKILLVSFSTSLAVKLADRTASFRSFRSLRRRVGGVMQLFNKYVLQQHNHQGKQDKHEEMSYYLYKIISIFISKC